jgi:hypothetical protein
MSAKAIKTKVSKSTIPNAGKGLFALDYVKKGELIIPIEGPRYPEAEAEKIDRDEYFLGTADGTNDIIDVRGPAMYANDARGLTRIDGLSNNAAFQTQLDNTIWLAATKTIRPGDEIFASYGRSYWATMRQRMKG